jgi:putative ABC transport system permease protein
MELGFWTSAGVIPVILVLAVISGLLAGIYPAVYLSKFKPSVILGGLKGGSSNSRLRQVLVVFQFVISITLLVGTVTITNQLNYLNNKPLGFNKENILYITDVEKPGVPPIHVLKEEMKNVTGVIGVATSSRVPTSSIQKSVFMPEGFAEDEAQTMDYMGIDADYIPLMNIKIVKGRNFSEALVTDTSESVIINTTAARNFGWSDDPIGKKFYFNPQLMGEEEEPYTMNVVGLIEDFHLYSLREKIEPLFMSNNPDGIDVISIKISESDITGTLKRLSDLWSEMVPTMPFNYLFLDDSINDQYQSEAGLKRLTRYFSVFAIFIGCLGLFGLSAFTAANRTKEIGIRKVLGATTPGIIGLLSKEFALLIILASVIAYPINWIIVNKWLETYAFQVGFSLTTTILVSLITMILALLTVSFQSTKAALANPVDSIHYE